MIRGLTCRASAQTWACSLQTQHVDGPPHPQLASMAPITQALRTHGGEEMNMTQVCTLNKQNPWCESYLLTFEKNTKQSLPLCLRENNV